MTKLDAVYAFVAAFAVAAVLTPLTARFARRVGAVDHPKARGLGRGATPLLGGLAIYAAALVTGLIFIQTTAHTHDRFVGILVGGTLITIVGAIDDRFDLHPAVKLLGQIVAAIIPVSAGVEVGNITVPFLGAVDFGSAGGPVTVVGLVAMMNVVNFSDGVDGLAAGVCAISAVAFSIIAFDLGRTSAGVLAAIIAGAALGFLIHNFHPASVFMGDCGALLLGYLLGCAAVQGSLKTNALIALVGPLAILAVPFLDTGFVIARRLKYKRAPWSADAHHFHHRMARIGFSQRRTVLYLYAWTFMLAGLAVAMRFIPYSDNHGSLNAGWSVVVAALALLVAAASAYLVYVLEILKLRRLSAIRIRRLRPDAAEAEVDQDVERQIETGEFEAVKGP